MTVKKITFADMMNSAQIKDLDAALLPLMNIAGIDDGGIAGIVFSGSESETWPNEKVSERIKMLAYWLAVEASYEKLESYGDDDDTSVHQYFKDQIGKVPADETLNDLPCDSNCGKDCVAVIDALQSMMTVSDPSLHAELIEASERAISIKWHG